ncbi:hypothetical protein LSTR_LSTR009120 [Laodelphax striatellus]|uniref:Poly A polymerase head domain-containing protein n=1 Tax=Laodelphax striatellus TaxID=195883 RepID=A0A482XQC0_LAOST|nr:hypothetical protein LSTR_LSTR009120 [Laodelphax striatellus]
MIVNSPEFTSLFTHALNQLFTIFKTHDYELRIAGGAVRDILLKKKPKDVDFATTATPDEMKAMFQKLEVRTINNKGESHGTVTARIDSENFEITTLRIDVVTDGRHAEVQFTTDWERDAGRRDLTVNSMFLDQDGKLYDYFNGYQDLMDRRVVFVGNTEQRIQEDYLRILRYFRFYGRIANSPDNHDPECVRIIEKNRQCLARISGERIWVDLKKIVTGNFYGDLLKTIIDCKLHQFLGLPDEPDMKEFELVLNNTRGVECNAITILSSMMKSSEEMVAFHQRCKLSCYERDLGLFLISHRNKTYDCIGDYKLSIVAVKAKSTMALDWGKELMKYRGDSKYIEEISNWTLPKFPIKGGMAVEHGAPAGKRLGPVLDRLLAHWVNSDFQMTPEELLKKVPEIVEELEKSRPKDRSSSPPGKKIKK